VYRPSSSIFFAPPIRSSAGCTTNTTVPRHASRIAASRRAVPTSEVMCTSCPQACITGDATPSIPTCTAADALGRPFASLSGSPSMSARTSTVGPSPLRITPTTPVPPTFSVTSRPGMARSSFAMRAAVAVSM
jgi:hypothetical protein